MNRFNRELELRRNFIAASRGLILFGYLKYIELEASKPMLNSFCATQRQSRQFTGLRLNGECNTHSHLL
jgi:hypothetical protein